MQAGNGIPGQGGIGHLHVRPQFPGLGGGDGGCETAGQFFLQPQAGRAVAADLLDQHLAADPGEPVGLIQIIAACLQGVGPIAQLQGGNVQLFAVSPGLGRDLPQRAESIGQIFPGQGDAAGRVAQGAADIGFALRLPGHDRQGKERGEFPQVVDLETQTAGHG